MTHGRMSHRVKFAKFQESFILERKRHRFVNKNDWRFFRNFHPKNVALSFFQTLAIVVMLTDDAHIKWFYLDFKNALFSLFWGRISWDSILFLHGVDGREGGGCNIEVLDSEFWSGKGDSGTKLDAGFRIRRGFRRILHVPRHWRIRIWVIDSRAGNFRLSRTRKYILMQ